MQPSKFSDHECSEDASKTDCLGKDTSTDSRTRHHSVPKIDLNLCVSGLSHNTNNSNGAGDGGGNVCTQVIVDLDIKDTTI